MAITIKIGGEQRSLADIHPEWIRHQIDRRRADGESVCVIVRIEIADVDMALATHGCSAGGHPKETFSPREHSIVQCWKRSGLDQPGFTADGLIRFLEYLREGARDMHAAST